MAEAETGFNNRDGVRGDGWSAQDSSSGSLWYFDAQFMEYCKGILVLSPIVGAYPSSLDVFYVLFGLDRHVNKQ